MPVRLIAGLAAVLTAGVLSVLAPTPANADVINGCDPLKGRFSDACLVYDTDGDGWLTPLAEIDGPPHGAVTAGSTVPVTITGTDLLRPATIGIHLTDGEDPEPTNLIASLTIGPGALTSTVDVPVGNIPGDHEYMAYIDTYGVDGLYVYESFDLTVLSLPSSLTSDLPPGRIVKVGAKSQAVTGTVSGGARPVHLQVRAKGNAWVSVAETTSAANGSYSLAVPTFWVGKHTYRAYAPEHGTLAAGEGTKTSSLTVKRTYKPKGSNAHSMLFGSARWNACAPIRYSVNTAKMPKWGAKEIRFALGQVSAATGLRFTKVAGTDHVPFARREKPYPAHADLVFAFSNPKTVPGLTGGTIGVGGAGWSGNVVSQGGVVIDVSQKPSRKSVWRQIMLHEVGHAMGLGHVGDQRQIMYPSANGKSSLYAKGDLRGLSALGAGAGACTGTSAAFSRVSARTPHGHTPSEPVREVVLP